MNALHRNSFVEVDLTAVDHNTRVIRRMIGPDVDLCAVLKADAYGLGAVRLAKRLGIVGVDMIAVFSLEQARELVDAAIQVPILVLMPAGDFDRSDPLYRAAAQNRLHLTVHEERSLELIERMAERLGLPIPVHVELDTGMSRGGTDARTARSIVERVVNHRRLSLAGLSTHFPSAASDDAATFEQATEFAEWAASLGDLVPDNCMLHQAATAGIIRSGALHGTMVRVGCGLLGFGHEHFPGSHGIEHAETARELKPVARWISKIIQERWIEPGSTVGYERAWRATRRTRVGLVPVGYADGYPRQLSSDLRHGSPGSATMVMVEAEDGERYAAPVIGRVSMDQITIDLTDLPSSVGYSAMVELFGRDPDAPNHVPILAHAARASVYELWCRVHARIPRVYLAVEEARASLATIARVAVA